MLSKVLHRKRPQLIPLLDRHIIDWLRPVTAVRSARAAWTPIVRLLRDDHPDAQPQWLDEFNADLAASGADQPFTAFDTAEAAHLLGRRITEPMTLAAIARTGQLEELARWAACCTSTTCRRAAT